MDQETIIDQLEELAGRFGIQIRYEAIKQDEDLVRIVGGLCLLRGEYVVIIDSKATMRDKIRTLAEAVKYFDLDKVYIRPAQYQRKGTLLTKLNNYDIGVFKNLRTKREGYAPSGETRCSRDPSPCDSPRD
jgi:hypothetical protein